MSSQRQHTLSHFERTFLTISPFSSELLSLLTTAAKFNLFACSSSLSLYRDACYTWQDVCLTKDGYEPFTSLANINYQIDARIRGPQRCSKEIELQKSLIKKSNATESKINNFFCPTFRSENIWAMINSRPGIGSVLNSITLDGTGANMKVIQDIIAKCSEEGRGLKYLSIRYCDRIRFEELLGYLPNSQVEEDDEVSEDSDSGFESSGEVEDDSIFRNLKVFRIYGIRDLVLRGQQVRVWRGQVDQFRKYCESRSIETDVAWCSPSPNGEKKHPRREGCKGIREVPFARVSPVADCGSNRKLVCGECNKTPQEMGYFCEACLKDLLCEDCNSFVCEQCDPSRDRLLSCNDCSIRRCKPCFIEHGGSLCTPTGEHTSQLASCGKHKRELCCRTCNDKRTVDCSTCYPIKKCRLCTQELYNHCEESNVFKCDCDYELCSDCFTDCRDTFLAKEYKHGSLEELVNGFGGDREDFPPIVPRILSASATKALIQTPAGWSCMWCRILPRRRERVIEQKIMRARHRLAAY